MNWQRKLPKHLLMLLLVALLGWSVTSCSKPPDGAIAILPKAARSKLVEVSPPFVIQNLRVLSDNQPQVKILSPRLDQVIDQPDVEVKLQVSDLSLYKDEALELGPYLQVWLDNQPYTQIYDVDEPLTLSNLKPGTHTLRIFAVRPWHESFKNDGAFAQTSFHLFAKTGENQPNPTQPLLTYNAPQDTVGAEPVLLDFYLTNAPLHLVAREDAEDEIPDWQIRCTINGESFTFDRWEPIYLKGFKPGRNWVQLELLDDKGAPLPNVFNNVVQLVTYEPGGNDTLSQMIRGELTAEAARKIIDPNYVPPAPEPEPEPELAPEPALEPEPEVISPGLLEPDLTQEPTPEQLPPEILAPVEDAPDPLPEVISKPDLSAPEATEPPFELELDNAEPADSIAPADAVTEPFKLIIAPEGDAAPVEVRPVPPIAPTPTLEPALPEPIQKGMPGSVREPLLESLPEKTVGSELLPTVEPDPLEAVKTRIEEVFQPNSPEQPEAIPLPAQLESTEPVQPLEINLSPATLPSFDSLLQPLEPDTPDASLVPALPEPPLQTREIPDMMSALNRVKGFFENLRKRPEEPTLPLLLEDIYSDDPIEPTAEALP